MLFLVRITNDLDRRIAEAFEIFDHAGNGTVDIREIGTIVRSLGCVPSEAELQEILVATEYPEATGCIYLSAFLPHMAQLITEHRLQPATPDQLLEAFRKIDADGRGYISKEIFAALLMEEGEQFSQDEIDEMMATACDPQTQTIPYEYYINQLMYQPPKSNDLYYIAEEIEKAKPKKSIKTASMILRAAEELQRQLGIE